MPSSSYSIASSTASLTPTEIFNTPSLQNNITAAVLITTTLGLFTVVAIIFYALHRGKIGLCPRLNDEESAASHDLHKLNRDMASNVDESDDSDGLGCQPNVSNKIEREAREYRRELLINNSRRCKDLMLQRYRVDDIPATYDCPFNSPPSRSQARRPSQQSPFHDNYQNSIVDRWTTSVAPPSKLEQRRCFSEVPPASMHCRYDRDIVIDYLNRHKSDPKPCEETSCPVMSPIHGSNESPFRSRRVSPKICATSPVIQPVSTFTEVSTVPWVDLGRLAPGIVSDEVRSKKSPVSSARRRRRQPGERSISEPVKLSEVESTGDANLVALRNMLRTHQESDGGQSTSMRNVLDDTAISFASSTTNESISVAAPCYKEAITGRVPIQALLVADISPLASCRNISEHCRNTTTTT